MSKSSPVSTEKSLPATPRQHDLIPPDDPEVCVHDGLHPGYVSNTLPEIPVAPGLERAFEDLHFVSIEKHSSTSTDQDEEMPSKRRKKRYVLGFVALVVVIVALAAGLGKGLQKRDSQSTKNQNLTAEDPPWKSFNASKPLPASEAKPDYWRSRSIYQIMTDRFATSDNSTPYCDTAQKQYCGGTWRGIINRLDYIKNMSFTAAYMDFARDRSIDRQYFRGPFLPRVLAAEPLCLEPEIWQH